MFRFSLGIISLATLDSLILLFIDGEKNTHFYI